MSKMYLPQNYSKTAVATRSLCMFIFVSNFHLNKWLYWYCFRLSIREPVPWFLC